jgi:hypothetical protein
MWLVITTIAVVGSANQAAVRLIATLTGWFVGAVNWVTPPAKWPIMRVIENMQWNR